MTGGRVVGGFTVVGIFGLATAGTIAHCPGLNSKSSTAISPW